MNGVFETAGITQERYMELKYICLQYAEYKASGSARWRERIDAIEQAASEADVMLGGYILRNVTQAATFESMAVPCGRNQFFRARQRFFLALDKLVA